MAKGKKTILKLITLCLLVCICATAVACKTKEPENDDKENPATVCNITVLTEGGMALPEIGVYVYTDSSKQDLVWFARTDAEGKVKFDGAVQEGYVAVLGDVPNGYTVNDDYPIKGENTQITLSTYLDADVDIRSLSFKEGDILVDFSVTSVDGTKYTLSELLKEKKAVVLNFWYTSCQPCKAEFPYLQEAYTKYTKDIALLALNPVDTNAADISAFISELGLTMPVAQCDAEWEKIMNIMAYPTTVVIDRYGMVSFIHSGSLPSTETFEGIFSYYAADDYKQGVVDSIDTFAISGDSVDTTTTEPLEFGGVTEFEVTVEPGETVTCNVYKISDMELRLESQNVSVKYNEETYTPKDGKIAFMVTSPDTFTPFVLEITNTGNAQETYKVTFYALEGSIANPYTMSMGEFTANVAAGNESGLYYTYTATENGTVTISCLNATQGVNYEYVLYNLTTYTYLTLSNDAVTDKNGNKAVSCYMNAGDELQFSIATLPNDDEYPAGTFQLSASFAAGEGDNTNTGTETTTVTYTAKVTDDANKPMANVSVTFIVDGSNMTIVTDSDGIVTMDLEEGTYAVKVTLPNGYTADKSEYSVSAKSTSVSIKLKKIVIVTATYTVKVVDNNNKPISNVLVSVGSSSGRTNASGVVSFTLPKGTYSAVIAVPSGYTSDKISFPFSSATSLTVTLKKGTTTNVSNAKKYSVTVVNAASGKAQTGVTVQFLKNGSAVAVAEVNSSGVATANLEAGNYTVLLAFAKGTYYYDKSAVALSSGTTSITIPVTSQTITGDPIGLYVGDAYPLETGATYVELPSSEENYFFFTPDKQGTYKFETTNSAAKVSYWGSNTSFIWDQTSTTDYKNNVFTLNIKESNLGANYIIGIVGTNSAIIKITRTGDAELDVSDLPWTIYKGTHTPKKYTLPAGTKLTYVDVTAASSSMKAVYNEKDGYYHLNSANGPLLYLDFKNAPYVQLANMLGWGTPYGGTPLRKIFYDANGKFVKKEDYTECVTAYQECIDATTGVYPLTKDLAYIIQQHGDFTGWWNQTSPNYLFTGVKVNTEIAWMFMCCYVA